MPQGLPRRDAAAIDAISPADELADEVPAGTSILVQQREVMSSLPTGAPGGTEKLPWHILANLCLLRVHLLF